MIRRSVLAAAGACGLAVGYVVAAGWEIRRVDKWLARLADTNTPLDDAAAARIIRRVGLYDQDLPRSNVVDLGAAAHATAMRARLHHPTAGRRQP